MFIHAKWQPYSHSGTFYCSNTPRMWRFFHFFARNKDILYSLSPPTRTDNSTQDGSFPLCASHRIILVCLFTPNRSHIDIVGRFIPSILLKCDDFWTFLSAIRTSCKAYCRPLEAIIRYRMVHSPSLSAIGEYWYVYSRKMAAILT